MAHSASSRAVVGLPAEPTSGFAHSGTPKALSLLVITIILLTLGVLAVPPGGWSSLLSQEFHRSHASAEDSIRHPVPSDNKASMAHPSHRAASLGRSTGGIWLSQMWNSYNRALATKPLATKIVTGMIGTVLGDAIAQYSAHRLTQPGLHTWTTPGGVIRHETTSLTFKYDVPRVMRLLLWSASVGTPLAHYWFAFLDQNVMPATPTRPLAVAIKLVLDQGVMAPIGTALFFAGMKALEGQPHLAAHEVRTKLWPVMQANWLVWPLANAINFAIIPPSQRILYVNILAVAWSAFMSHMSSKPARATHAQRASQHHSIQMNPLETSPTKTS